MKIQCTSVNGNSLKEQLNMFACRDPKKVCIMLLKGIKSLTNRCKWFDASSDNNGVKLEVETTSRASLGDPLELWEITVDDL